MQEIQATEKAIMDSQASIDKAETARLERVKQIADTMEPSFTSQFGGNRAARRAAERARRKGK